VGCGIEDVFVLRNKLNPFLRFHAEDADLNDLDGGRGRAGSDGSISAN
jgi:hypothetical protein